MVMIPRDADALAAEVRRLNLQNSEYAGRCGNYAKMLEESNKQLREANRLNGEIREQCAEIAEKWRITDSTNTIGPLWVIGFNDACGQIANQIRTTSILPKIEKPKCDHEWMDGGDDEVTGAVDICKKCGISFHQVHTEKRIHLTPLETTAEQRACQHWAADLNTDVCPTCGKKFGPPVTDCNHVPDHNPETGRTYCERCGTTL